MLDHERARLRRDRTRYLEERNYNTEEARRCFVAYQRHRDRVDYFEAEIARIDAALGVEVEEAIAVDAEGVRIG